jgi:general secretion pathway protein E
LTALDCGLNALDPADPSTPVCESGCVIAMRDPLEFQALDDLVRLLDTPDYRLVLSTRETILSAINLQYDLRRDSAAQLVQDMEENGSSILHEIEETADLLDDTSEAPIIKLVNHHLAVHQARASDIHFEPYQNSFTVRYRVDGILYDLLTSPKWIQPALLSGSRSCQDEHRRGSVCPRTAGSTCAWETRTSTCACRPSRPPSANGWCCGC